jgi:hypothetical protein
MFCLSLNLILPQTQADFFSILPDRYHSVLLR